MSKLIENADGSIQLDPHVGFPKFLYEKLTEEELVEVRKFMYARFEMGYLYGLRE